MALTPPRMRGLATNSCSLWGMHYITLEATFNRDLSAKDLPEASCTKVLTSQASTTINTFHSFISRTGSLLYSIRDIRRKQSECGSFETWKVGLGIRAWV